MKQIMLTVAITIFAFLPAYGQAPSQQSSISPCKLDVAHSPAIRGVRLGMTAEDVAALFQVPNGADWVRTTLKEASNYPNMGVAQMRLDPNADYGKDRLAGIEEFSVTLLDDRVVMVFTHYLGLPLGPSWHDVDDFVAKVSDTFHLPSTKDWATLDQYGKKHLQCGGFEIVGQVWNGTGTLAVYDSGYGYGSTQKERRSAYEQSKQREFKP